MDFDFGFYTACAVTIITGFRPVVVAADLLGEAALSMTDRAGVVAKQHLFSDLLVFRRRDCYDLLLFTHCSITV